MHAQSSGGPHDELQALTETHVIGELAAGVHIEQVTAERWDGEIYPLARSLVTTTGFNHREVLTSDERKRCGVLDAALGATPYVHRLVFTEGGRIVAGYWGEQEGRGRYHMCLTAFVPEVRGRGLYSAFLQRILRWAGDAGFLEVVSKHVADNNAVLVPKLKAGFVVSGFEITPNLGLLLQLRYVFAPLLREVHAYRVGSLADGGEVLRARGALFPVEP